MHGYDVDNVLSSKMMHSWRAWVPTPNVWILKSGATGSITVQPSHQSKVEHAMRCVCIHVCALGCPSVVCVCLLHNVNFPVPSFIHAFKMCTNWSSLGYDCKMMVWRFCCLLRGHASWYNEIICRAEWRKCKQKYCTSS